MKIELGFLNLQCFLLAAKHLNFRLAAKLIHLSPTAFGQRIAALEKELGYPLFERTTRRVSLTESGIRAIPLAQEIIQKLEQLRQERPAGAATPSELTIGTRFELGLSWLTPSLSALARKRPARTLHLSFGDGDDILARVWEGKVDAAITSSRKLPASAQYVTLHLEEYRFVGQRQLLLDNPLTSPKEASNHHLIDLRDGLPLFQYFLDASPRSELWQFRHTEYMGTIAAIKARVLEGQGVAVLPAYFIAEELREKQLVPILPKIKLKTDSFRLVWLKDHPRQQALLDLAEDLREIPLS